MRKNFFETLQKFNKGVKLSYNNEYDKFSTLSSISGTCQPEELNLPAGCIWKDDSFLLYEGMIFRYIPELLLNI